MKFDRVQVIITDEYIIGYFLYHNRAQNVVVNGPANEQSLQNINIKQYISSLFLLLLSYKSIKFNYYEI